MASSMFKRALLSALTIAATVSATALVLADTQSADAAAAPCEQTFSSALPGAVTGSFTIVIPPLFTIPGLGNSTAEAAAGTIADVDVTAHITAPSAEGLTLTVQHGAGNLVLKNGGGTAGANFAGTTFDDEATQAISAGTPPYSGRFQPVAALSAFDGTSAGGTWTLSASNFSPTPAVIDSWSVTVTYAGTCNYDGDSVEDHTDACVGVAGATASGCPLASSSLTAKYRKGKFKGVLSSTVPGCRAAKSVTIWKVHRGPDRKVGTTTTSSAGAYKLKRARHPGRYYATSPRVVLTDVAECPAVTSPKLRLR